MVSGFGGWEVQGPRDTAALGQVTGRWGSPSSGGGRALRRGCDSPKLAFTKPEHTNSKTMERTAQRKLSSHQKAVTDEGHSWAYGRWQSSAVSRAHHDVGKWLLHVYKHDGILLTHPNNVAVKGVLQQVNAVLSG